MGKKKITKKIVKQQPTKILGLGYRALKMELKQIFRILSVNFFSADWPETFHIPLKKDKVKWVLYLNSINTMQQRQRDKDINVAMIIVASETFQTLSKQNWNQDLWVIFCENMSEMVKDEIQYDKIIEIVLLTAKYETTCIKKRFEDMASLVTENIWWTLFQNVEPLLTDVYQKCKFAILFFALSEKQKECIFNNLSKALKDSTQNLATEDNSSHVLMTHERWVNLYQVTELLKKKRGLLRLLSLESLEDNESKEEQESATSAATTEEHDLVKEEPKCEHEPVMVEYNEDKIKDHEENQSSSAAERIKAKQKPNTYVFEHPKVKNEFVESSELEQLAEINLPNSPGLLKVKQEPHTDTFETIEVENNDVKKEQDTKVLAIPVEQLIEVKKEPDTSEATVTEPLIIKQEQVKEEDDIQILTPPPLKETESISQIKDQQSQNKQNTEDDTLSSLDKLILKFSFEQINKSKGTITINEECIDISEDDDDDCIIHEDSKLEVAQLLNIYCNMVSEEPKRMVKNPLADQKDIKGIEAENFIKIRGTSQDCRNSAGPHEISSTIIERNSSTSSSTTSKSSKMNVQMSSQKLQNKIKRNRSKTNASVKKLFEQLRNESQASCSTEDNTVIVLDNTLTPNAPQKRKMSPKSDKKKFKKGRYFSTPIPNSTSYVAPIGNENINLLTPKKPVSMACSTPIIKKNKEQPEFIPIISNISNSNNNKSVKNFNEEVTDLTKEINRDSYLTIDLTTESANCSSISKTQNTVIDLDNSVDPECTVVSVDNDNLSISGESDVTVLNMPQAKKERQMRRFVKGISKLDASEKGRLLELITQNIFSGCSVVDKKKSSLHNLPTETSTRATETAEDTYIKEVIVGQSSSRNSIGSNIYNPEKDARNKTGLRMIVIDGSNVAMEHGRGQFFSVKGLKICIDYFLRRGHVVKAFVPRFRCKFGKSTDPRLLDEMERRGLVVYTPSREIQGKLVTSYDDRYIVQCAAEFDGVIVSGDNYRDLLLENPRWRFIIENRLLMFTWVQDMIMFPRDPLGRTGPSLEQFLRHPNPQNPQSFPRH